MTSIGISSFRSSDRGTTIIYTLSLHDALPISKPEDAGHIHQGRPSLRSERGQEFHAFLSPPNMDDLAGWDATAKGDRKSTRLNSSHVAISYAVFCLKKKSEMLPLVSCNTSFR